MRSPISYYHRLGIIWHLLTVLPKVGKSPKNVFDF
jgi:hypothetical protein